MSATLPQLDAINVDAIPDFPDELMDIDCIFDDWMTRTDVVLSNEPGYYDSFA